MAISNHECRMVKVQQSGPGPQADWKVGDRLGSSRWMRVTQKQIDAFGEVTDDIEPLHNDPVWCARHSPYLRPIAYGFLTLSLLTRFMHEATDDALRGHVGTRSYPLNYGFDRIRFVAPVVADARIRAHFILLERKRRDEGDMLRVEVTVEIDGEDRPALIADWLTLWVADTARA